MAKSTRDNKRRQRRDEPKEFGEHVLEIRRVTRVVRGGRRLRFRATVILGDGKKMHLFHRMMYDDTLLATGEHMLIHVSLETRRASKPAAHIAANLATIADAHAVLPLPEGAGKAVGAR